MRSSAPSLLLTGLVVLALTQIEHVIVVACVLPFLCGLLAIELDRRGGQLSRALVRGAALLLPAGDRTDLRDEWLDHVASAGEHGLAPLTSAATIALIAAPLLAVGLRVGRRKHRGA